MSWKPEVQVRGEGAKWYDNQLRFATQEEAEAAALHKYTYWTLATAYRVVESEDPVNYTWANGEAHFIKETDNAHS